MLRFIFAICSLFFILTVSAQNFEPAPSTSQDKLENFLKKYGSIKRIYLADAAQKTFEGKPGIEYFAWFVFDAQNKATRRMMIIQLGDKGEKVKIHYQKTSSALTDGVKQAFGIGFIAPTEISKGVITYKVDASPEASVYIYEVTRGVKRDAKTGEQNL
jgi:hypothetical protein